MKLETAILFFLLGSIFWLTLDQVKVEKRLSHLESVTFGSSRCPK
jgi:hypothetical protein